MKKLLITVFFSVALISVIAIILINSSKTIDPPQVPYTDTSSFKTVSSGDSLVYCGKSWFHKSRTGLYELYTEGDAYYRGLAAGKLTRDLSRKQEKIFVRQINKFVPSKSYRRFLNFIIDIFNRKIDTYIKPEFLQEIFGVSKYADDQYKYIGSNYQRMLNYHAAHDIGHMMQNYHLVGCTSFAVWDERSKDSSLLVGRNFDFFINDDFAEDKIISFVKPDSGYNYMMISWGGMTGVVSGMNDQGLTVTINAAKSQVPLHSACPVSLVAKHILQYARNIREAFGIAGRYQVFVSESFMIGSAKDKKACIIEKSPEKTVLFENDSNYIICTNHFQSTEYASDKLNIMQMNETPTVYRFKRVEQLIRNSSPMDENSAAALLRNPDGMDDKKIGYTNELAVNQFIAHHSVIFKPEQLLVWVSTTPYQAGTYVCYDLNKIFQKKECLMQNTEMYEFELSLLPDSVMLSDYSGKIAEYKKIRDAFVDHLNSDITQANAGDAEKMTGLNPEFYQPYYLAGEYYYKNKSYGRALEYYRKALEKSIPYLADRELLKKRMEACKSKTIKYE
ncbi:MAG TPA: C45 family autoproteolytic acyltransferase/hydrolase [Bacteroidales bacterium]|nr:C45 family autoproteolytic acyltransferase/hydrolase [Bacteroidales bacterium]